MALQRYGVIRGKLKTFKDAGTRFHHVQLHLVADHNDYRVSVNVKSKLDNSHLEYYLDEAFEHPLLQQFAGLAERYQELPRRPATLALDYIRSNILEPQHLTRLAFATDDLNAKLSELLADALTDDSAQIVAFGEPWGPEAHKDNIFGFEPAYGVHNVHMNQGNATLYQRDDGVWQDGALFICLAGRWQALFLKFQSQAWHTDDQRGHALTRTAQAHAHGLLRILGVRFKPGAKREVMLKNHAPTATDLNRWALANRQKERTPLKGTVQPQQTLTFTLEEGFLDEDGDTLTLLDPAGLKVDGTSFTAAKLRQGYAERR